MAIDSIHKDFREGDIVYRYRGNVYPEVDKKEVGFIASLNEDVCGMGVTSYNVEFADSKETLCAHDLVLADVWTESR